MYVHNRKLLLQRGYMKASNEQKQIIFYFTLATKFATNTIISSQLTVHSPQYMRPMGSSSNFYYDTFELAVSIAGNYTIGTEADIFNNNTIDTYGSLYSGTFLPEHPDQNLFKWNDDGDNMNQFQIKMYLDPYSIYTLVVTTHQEYVTGWYTVVIAGRAAVNLTRTTKINTTPIPFTTGSS